MSETKASFYDEWVEKHWPLDDLPTITGFLRGTFTYYDVAWKDKCSVHIPEGCEEKEWKAALKLLAKAVFKAEGAEEDSSRS